MFEDNKRFMGSSISVSLRRKHQAQPATTPLLECEM